MTQQIIRPYGAGWLIAIVVIAGLLFTAGLLYLVYNAPAVGQGPSMSLPPGVRIEVLSAALTNEPGTRHIEGTLKNTGIERASPILISFTLYNERGEKVDDTNDYCGVLNPGQTWHFSAPFIKLSATKFTIDGVKAY